MSCTVLFEVRRRPGLGDEEFVANWLRHADLAARLPGLRYYEILPVESSLEAPATAPGGFVIMRFDSRAEAEAAFASPEMAAAGADVDTFAEGFATYFVDSHRIA